MRDLTKFEVNQFNMMLNTFNALSMKPIDEVSEKWLLEILPTFLPLFTHLTARYKLPKIERVTINRNILNSNKRIKDIDFLKYPPANKVSKYGRCNLKGQSVFYGAPMIMTAHSEMKPKKGDLITRSIWKIKEPYDFKICPIFHIQPTNGSFNPKTHDLENSFYELVNSNFEVNSREVVINLTKFIAYHFSKHVDRDNHRDYLFSAFFADKLLNELENGSIEGILYPSVQEHLSFENIVLKPDVFDKHFILDEVHESIVFKDPSDGEGGLLMGGINDCKTFDYENNKILWNNDIMQPKEEMEYFQKTYNIDLT